MLSFSRCLLLLFVSGFECTRKYEGYNLFHTVPQNADHLRYLKSMKDSLKVEFWRRPTKIYYPTEFILHKINRSDVLYAALRLNLSLSMLPHDVQSIFDQQKVNYTKKYERHHANTLMFYQYYEPDDISGFLFDIAKDFPKRVEHIRLGKSYLGRPIVAIEINKDFDGPAVVVEAGMHGNEWITVAFALYLIRELLIRQKKRTDIDDDFMANSFHWYIIPVVNPDGFVYTHLEDRLWRRNRNDFPVDLNRNFDILHGRHESSFYRSSPYYCGPSPFSEPETRAIRGFIYKKQDKIKYYFSIHAYGQQIAIPHIGTPEHLDEMVNIAKLAAEKMGRVNDVPYQAGKHEEITGTKMSGTSAHWVKSKIQNASVFTFYLRDNGTFGYGLPASEIFKACEEVYQGIKLILSYRERTQLRRYTRDVNLAERNIEAPRHILLLCIGILFYK